MYCKTFIFLFILFVNILLLFNQLSLHTQMFTPYIGQTQIDDCNLYKVKAVLDDT